MAMDLQAPLEDILVDFLYCELARVLHQAAELKSAMKFHQARMKDVCYSIKAHYPWETLEVPFDFSKVCWFCGETISPEFGMHRHMGLCDLKERLADEALPPLSAHESFYPHLYPLEESLV